MTREEHEMASTALKAISRESMCGVVDVIAENATDRAILWRELAVSFTQRVIACGVCVEAERLGRQLTPDEAVSFATGLMRAMTEDVLEGVPVSQRAVIENEPVPGSRAN